MNASITPMDDSDTITHAPPMEARVEARCGRCGPVEFALARLRVHSPDLELGVAEFRCPRCGRLNVHPVDARDLAALTVAGIPTTRRPGPLELLERHDGPPIGWDDVLDFHQAMATPAAVRERGRGRKPAAARRATVARERDAA